MRALFGKVFATNERIFFWLPEDGWSRLFQEFRAFSPDIVISYFSLCFFSIFGGFQKLEVPQNGWVFKWKTLLKWMIWGETHYFRKHPYTGGIWDLYFKCNPFPPAWT